MNITLNVNTDSDVYINDIFYCSITYDYKNRWTKIELLVDNTVVKISNKYFSADSYFLHKSDDEHICIENELSKEYVNIDTLSEEDKKNKDKVVASPEDAVQGALDIIAEDISDNSQYRKCYGKN